MYFKKLEIAGFKSFGERTALYFEPGITAIVGPNGCGKSNIIDSIRWVLGEQSIKSLRGAKMDDVIFNGTEEREPINMAEVSLTLSNKDKVLPIDSGEVVISRRLFRSGESEYLLNKTPVRLKDITELLMGTGIGAEAYSIIGQGKIDLILSSKPEERRFIFEEASGITKYKAKKREAIRKLDSTDNNLLRVSDIIAEVKRQINSITRQAKKAERYKERFDRLKELETAMASYDYDSLKKEQSEMEAQSSNLKSGITSVSNEIEALKEKLEDERLSLNKIDEKDRELQGGKFSIESSIDKSRSKIDTNRERVAEIIAAVERLRNEIDFIQKRKGRSEKLVEELESKFFAVSDSEETKKEFLHEKEKALERLESEIKENDKRIKDSKQMMVDQMSKRSKSKNEAVRLASDIHNRSLRLRRLDIEFDKVSGEASSLKEKLEGARKQFKDAESRANNIRLERARLAREKEAVSLLLNSLEDKFQEEKNELITLESKKSFLEGLIARNEGFAVGVKTLLDAREKRELHADGIKGVLGNMIQAKRGCEFAIEAALGDYAQCLVCDNRDSALKAASHLSANKQGRAAFLILNELSAIEERNWDPIPKGTESVLGRLVDFVKVDKELNSAIAYLLDGWYLIENIEASKGILDSLSRRAVKNVSLVTKTGEICGNAFIKGGAGPKGQDSGIIGRKDRLKDTLVEVESSKKAIVQIENERAGIKHTLTEFAINLKNIEGLLKEEEGEYHKKQSLLTITESENTRLTEELSLIGLEKDEVGEELREFTSRKDKLEGRLKEIEQEESNTQNVLFNAQEAVKKYSKEREETVVFIAKIKTEIHALSKEKSGISENLSLQKDSFEAYSKSLIQKSSEADESNKKKDELEEESRELEREIVRLSEELKSVNEKLAEIGENRINYSSAISVTEKRLAGLYSVSAEKKESEHHFEMKKSEIGFKLEALRNRMAQLYKLEIDTIKREYDPSSNWDTIRREIEELNRKLESMGTVNLVAIEEHKELEERFNFLSHQQEDLNKAKGDIQKAIITINKTTRKLFLETFEKIQFEFKNYFRYLFGGGQAEIYLIDERDVLESGIEIIVRPPGKKLQNITLLSGGEKALTAIALIYAIFKVKPSPFCLLDEVDAPLDESNIDRFSKALREFTKKSQFIVITHNKKTITLADVMYGITMEKSGISKIVSVKFHEEHKDKKGVKETSEERGQTLATLLPSQGSDSS